MSKKVSEEFDAALTATDCNGGTLKAQCNCARTHFATGQVGDLKDDPESFGPYASREEVEELRHHAHSNPNKYHEHPEEDAVGVATIGAATFVHGCQCGQLASLERVWWENRALIERLYANRRARILADLQKEGQPTILQPMEKTEIKLATLQPWKSGHPDETQIVGTAERGGKVVATLKQKRSGTRITEGDMEAGGLIAGKLPDPAKMVFPPANQTQEQQPNT